MSYKLYEGTLGEESRGLQLQRNKIAAPDACLPCIAEYEKNLIFQKKCVPCRIFDTWARPPKTPSPPRAWQAGVCAQCGNPYQRNTATQKRCDPCRAADFSVESAKKNCVVCGRPFYAFPICYTTCQRCRSSRHLAKRRYTNTIEYRRMRSIILEKMGGQCAKCHKPISDPSAYHLHHIVPVCDHGEDAASNMTLVCFGCHKILHDRMRRGICQDIQLRTLASALS